MASTLAMLSRVPLVLTLVLALMVTSTLAQGGADEHKHLHYTRVDEVEAGEEISNLPEEAGLRYSASELYRLQYDIVKGDQRDYFTVDAGRGVLKTTRKLDRDVVCAGSLQCDILLDVVVVQPNRFFEMIKVTLTLIDANDNDPAFPGSEITLELSENAAPPVSFVLPSAVDPDSGLFGVQSYALVSDYTEFGLETSNDGSGLSDVRLVLLERLDREEVESYDVYVVASDGGQPARSGTMTVHVVVTDANDNSPTFPQSLYNASLQENFPLHTAFMSVTATDPDQDLNGHVVYSIAPQIPTPDYVPTFTINNETGAVSLIRPLDYETQDIHHLLVAARDLGPDSVPVHAKIIVHVQDVNDFVPEIHINTWSSTGDIEVNENAEPGAFVAHVSVEDRDLGPSGKVTCHVADNSFSLVQIAANTYKMITTVRLDREQQEILTVSVNCQDQGSPPLPSTYDVTVHVVDVNDHAPVFERSRYVGKVPETSPVGYSVLRVRATDDDSGENARITYHLHANSRRKVSVDPDTGVVTTNSVLDHETEDRMVFNILAMDSGDPAYTATATVTLMITDVNDEAPAFLSTSYNFGTYENTDPGTFIGQLQASDKDSPPFDSFLYSLADNKAFSIDPHSGIIKNKRILDREHQAAYTLLAYATDDQPPYLSGSVSVTIYVTDKNDNAPGILFPKGGENSSVELSAYSPHGYIVTRVRAEDADQSGTNNSKLRYTLAKGNDDDLFKMDPASGVLSVAGDLRQTSQDAFPLLIMVQDSGDDVKSAVAPLTVLINRTEAFAASIDLSRTINVSAAPPLGVPPVPGDAAGTGSESPDDENLHLRYQHVILIILAAITVVLVSILVTAIVCIKKRQRYRHRDSYKYMCRIDLANHISATQGGAASGSAGGGEAGGAPDQTTYRRGSASSLDEDVELDKGQFVRFDARDSGIPIPSLPGSLSDVSNGSQVALQIALANGGKPVDKAGNVRDEPGRTTDDLPAYPGPPGPDGLPVYPGPPGQPGNSTLPTIRASDKPVPIQNILSVMPGERDSDSTSGCSADMSNSDGSRQGHPEVSETPCRPVPPPPAPSSSTNSLRKQYNTTGRKPCPTHGKNVRFGDVTCHSPTRGGGGPRDYSTCPLPQCGANHRHRAQPTLVAPPGSPVDNRYDDRTGCHGGASSLNLRKPSQSPNPPNNGRIHPQPPLVMTTFGYDEAIRRRQANGGALQGGDPETRSLLPDSKKIHSVDV